MTTLLAPDLNPEAQEARERTLRYLDERCVAITAGEAEAIEVVDFGLSDLERTGRQLLTYGNTDRCCAKELVLFSSQTCPEHRYPPVDGDPGKMETFRCRTERAYPFGEGTPVGSPAGRVPEGDEAHYTVSHEIVLEPGQQYTIPPNTRHWFQAGPEGALVSEFSSMSRDEFDVFTDPRIRRV
jgi:D-lyxose ketol-isomerase